MSPVQKKKQKIVPHGKNGSKKIVYKESVVLVGYLKSFKKDALTTNIHMCTHTRVCLNCHLTAHK